MKLLKLWLLTILWLSAAYLSTASAQNDFHIIPETMNEAGVKTEVIKVGKEWWSVRDNYNEISKRDDRTLWDEMASGIMTWDTILNYVVYLVKFLSQIGLTIWAIMIIYAGYTYSISIFRGWNVGKGKDGITQAIQWVIVISFSYAIMKFLTSAFIS